ncbi:MAG: pre-peptidase C-terminal domain-containing protein [Treponema sp.]|jgi:hypothetical protein|nr:pre-peptidase C-terminal domain-containing protein [Treponema sp.]
MKKYFSFLVIFFLFTGNVFSQNTDNSVRQMDEAVKTLAREIHAKLTEKRAEKVTVGQFVFNNGTTTFSSYWVNQLTSELTNINGRNYIILSGGTAPADWTISGEIIQAVDIIRVYTSLTRSQDRAIEGSFLSNFQRNEQINNMLAVRSGTANSSSSSLIDQYEPDSWESPVTYTIGAGSQSAVVMNRALTEGDEDFFLLIPERDGRLTAETTGNIDTYMHLYDYESEEELASDDDGGVGNNARITLNVRAGRRYLAVVRGYNSSVTGPYGFKAFINFREGMSSFNNPVSYEIGMGEDNVTTVQRRLQSGDEEYFLLIPTRDGRLTIETTGRIDTYMELYDSDNELLDEDDDSGNSYNARIRYNVRAGRRYIAKVRGYSDSVSGSYGFRAFFPGAGMLGPDEYEPDDDPSQAKILEIGSPQRRTFHSKDDVDWVQFHITRSGRYVINARGVNNNRLDTYLELFDSNLNSIAEDDDGGEGLSARITRNLSNGTYFLKVWCLDEEPDQGYILSLDAAQ